MKQSYDSSLHTKTGLQNTVSGTSFPARCRAARRYLPVREVVQEALSSGFSDGTGKFVRFKRSSAVLSSDRLISDHKTERVAATNGPAWRDGFSSNNADGETAPVSSGTSNKSSGTTSSTAGTTLSKAKAH